MPTGVFCCGAECGIVAVGATTGTTAHWTNGLNGPVTQTTVKRSGDRAHLFVGANLPCRLEKNLVIAPTVAVLRAYIRFPSSDLPDGDYTVLGFVTAASNTVGLRYNTATQTLTALAIATTGGSFAVTADTWYRIDMRVNVGTTNQIEWSVDGVAQTTASQGTPSTLTTLRAGIQLTGTTLATGTGGSMYMDDLFLSFTSGDYPIGAGQIGKLVPASDGTHSFDLAGDFKYNDSTNIPTNATDTWSYVDDLLTSITDFLSINGAAVGEYLEWKLSTLGFTATTINGVEVVTAHHSQGTAANKQTLRMVDGVSTSDVMADADFSNTGIGYGTKHYATAPSTSGAWTQALVEALKFRWAGSFTAVDNSPAPYIDGLTLEVDFIPTTTPTVSLQLTAGLMCFTIDHLVQMTVGAITGQVGAESPSSFVRLAGVRTLVNQAVHHYLRGETQDR